MMVSKHTVPLLDKEKEKANMTIASVKPIVDFRFVRTVERPVGTQ